MRCLIVQAAGLGEEKPKKLGKCQLWCFCEGVLQQFKFESVGG